MNGCRGPSGPSRFGAEDKRNAWRCWKCGLILGIVRGGRLHIKVRRGAEYLVGLPVWTACSQCTAQNERLTARTPD